MFGNFKLQNMDSSEMTKRTKQFSIDCGHLILSLATNVVNHAYSAQLIRSSSSVGANYRATRRAKSKADFLNKFKIVEEELDESLFFLELIVEFNKDKRNKIVILYKEGEEILKMIVGSIKTLRK
jgi:four helix bundle protein